MKYKLRLGVSFYVCILLFTPGEYTLYSICVDGMASIVSICITTSFIAYLQSRKPNEKNILNRQMVISFCLKYLSFVFYFMAMVLGYTVKFRPPTDLENSLMSTFLSYSSGRIVTILSVANYTLMSASRTLMFISPATFQNLNVNFFKYLSMAILFSLTLTELILSQMIFASDKCDVNEMGYELHTLTNFFPPSFEPSSKARETDKEVESIDKLSLNSTLYTFNKSLKENYEITNHSLYDRFHFLNQTEKKTAKIKTCTLFPTLRVLMILLLVLESGRIITAIARKVKRMKTQAVHDIPKNRTAQKNPVQFRVQPKPVIPKPKLKRSESFPITSGSNLNFPRRGSHHLSICMPKPTEIRIEISIGDSEEKTVKSNSLDYKKLKNYVLYLVLRTYSLVVVIVLIYLCSFFLPIEFYFFWQLKFQYIIVKLDLFLIPVVWIIIDKDVWHYTSKKIKDKYLAYRIRFDI